MSLQGIMGNLSSELCTNIMRFSWMSELQRRPSGQRSGFLRMCGAVTLNVQAAALRCAVSSDVISAQQWVCGLCFAVLHFLVRKSWQVYSSTVKCPKRVTRLCLKSNFISSLAWKRLHIIKEAGFLITVHDGHDFYWEVIIIITSTSVKHHNMKTNMTWVSTHNI